MLILGLLRRGAERLREHLLDGRLHAERGSPSVRRGAVRRRRARSPSCSPFFSHRAIRGVPVPDRLRVVPLAADLPGRLLRARARPVWTGTRLRPGVGWSPLARAPPVGRGVRPCTTGACRPGRRDGWRPSDGCSPGWVSRSADGLTLRRERAELRVAFVLHSSCPRDAAILVRRLAGVSRSRDPCLAPCPSLRACRFSSTGDGLGDSSVGEGRGRRESWRATASADAEDLHGAAPRRSDPRSSRVATTATQLVEVGCGRRRVCPPPRR